MKKIILAISMVVNIQAFAGTGSPYGQLDSFFNPSSRIDSRGGTAAALEDADNTIYELKRQIHDDHTVKMDVRFYKLLVDPQQSDLHRKCITLVYDWCNGKFDDDVYEHCEIVPGVRNEYSTQDGVKVIFIKENGTRLVSYNLTIEDHSFAKSSPSRQCSRAAINNKSASFKIKPGIASNGEYLLNLNDAILRINQDNNFSLEGSLGNLTLETADFPSRIIYIKSSQH